MKQNYYKNNIMPTEKLEGSFVGYRVNEIQIMFSFKRYEILDIAKKYNFYANSQGKFHRRFIYFLKENYKNKLFECWK